VTTVQRHLHLVSFKEKLSQCRFNYPRSPSTWTLIPKPSELHNPEHSNAAFEKADDVKATVFKKTCQ